MLAHKLLVLQTASAKVKVALLNLTVRVSYMSLVVASNIYALYGNYLLIPLF